MSLKPEQINDLVRQCKYYKNKIRLPKYIRPWIDRPRYTYNLEKKCRQLREEKSVYHPLFRTNDTDGIYSYKTNKPLDELGGQTIRTGFGLTLRPVRKFESFSRNDQKIFDIIFIIIIIFLIIRNF